MLGELFNELPDIKNLSDENKAKCYSSMVTIEFDPNEVLIDITNVVNFKRRWKPLFL